MKTLMPGFRKQSCALLVSACLVVSTTPISAEAADNLPRHTSARSNVSRLLAPSSSGLVSGSSAVASASLSLSAGDEAAANFRLPALSSAATKEKSFTTSLQAMRQPARHRKARVSSKAKFHNVSNVANQLTFVENKGQFDGQVKFQVSNAGRALWLTQTGISFDFQQCKSTEGALLDSGPARSDPNSVGQRQITRLARKELPDCSMERHVIGQDFLGASQQPVIERKGIQSGVRNYLAGNDSTKWQTQVRGFSEVVYRDVWQGIDLRLYGKGSDLEQEFIVRPGADLKQVQVAYRGIEQLEVARDGSLLIRAAGGQMSESRPRIYQEIAGRRVSVRGRFRLLSATSYTFDVPTHNDKYPLVIDPTLLYSTFLGGSAGNNIFTIGTRETATGIAVDQSGNAYVTGFTQSPDFPTTAGAFQTSFSAGQQTFVSKLTSAGSTLIYSTYLNASFPTSIAVDQLGNVYVAGSNAHPGFATTANAYNPTCDTAGGSAFLTTLNPSGSGLVYSTCFGFNVPNVGGAPIVTAMTADSVGHAFVAGFAGGGSTLPTTPNAYQSIYPGSLTSGFVMEFDTTVSGTNSLIYSTYLGIVGPVDGTHPGTTASAVAVDTFGKIYLTGFTADGFPVTPGAFQTVHSPCIPNGSACPASGNAFIAKLDPTASGQQSLIYATYFGGIGHTATNAIAVDASGAAYLTGSTDRYSSFPVTPGASQTTAGQNISGASFVTKLNAAGSQLVYSTLVSNLRSSSGNSIAVDPLGNAYITGQVNGSTFPVTLDAFQSSYAGPTTDFGDAFLAKLNATGSALIYSSYLGGTGDDGATAVAVDQTGDAYIAGHTSSFDLPVTANALQPSIHGTGDAFVAKFPLSTDQALSLSSLMPSSGGNSGTVTLQVFGTGIHAGATAQLNCPSPIVGTNLTVGPGGRFLNTTVSLTDTQPGICDVVVTNPGGSTATLSQAFSVQQGGAPNIQIYLTGVEARKVPAEVASGPANEIVFATISNIGNVDSTGGFVSLSLNPPFTLTSGNPQDLANVGQNSSDDFDVLNSGPMAAGRSQILSVTAMTPMAPVCADSSLPAVQACFYPYTGTDYRHFLSCMESDLSGLDIAKCSVAAVVCAGSPETILGATACISGALDCGGTIGPIISRCLNTSRILGPQICISDQLPCVQPTDPNSLVGPPGVGGKQWMPGVQALSYVISFENIPAATAPAQQVIVTEPLGTNVNLATLELLGITIPNGSNSIQIPIPTGAFSPVAGIDEFTTNVDLRPTQNLLVSVDAKLDRSPPTLTWTFTSIDSATGQPPLNPLVGFLPAGAGANVSFGVTPKQDLTTGSQIAEQATIVFQGAGPLSTQIWANTIDNTAPMSQVTPLPSSEPASGFNLSWSGTDIGSGIQDFTIFVSDNGGPFTPFQTNATATSATFTGEVGHTYGFYSIARDLVGNIEAAKSAADTTTQVVLVTDNTPPTTAALLTPLPNAEGWNNSNVTITLNSADNPGGTGIKQISYSASGAQTITSTTLTGSSTSFSISTEGFTTIKFFAVDNAGNPETPKTITVKLDKTPPTITNLRTPSANGNGWNNSQVTVAFTCADTLSGLAAGSPPAPTVLSTEGANESVTGTCQDLAGNSASATVSGINIDTTPPSVACSVSPNVLWPPNNKLVPVNATVTVTESLSGSAGFNLLSVTSNEPNSGQGDIQGFVSETPSVLGQFRAQRLGSGNGRVYTLTYAGSDRAGNSATCTTTVTVPHDQGH